MESRISRIQKRGNITIPREFREKIGLHPGTAMSVTIRKNGDLVLRPVADLRVNEAMAALDALGKIFKDEGLTVDQFIAKARKERRRLIAQKMTGA